MKIRKLVLTLGIGLSMSPMTWAARYTVLFTDAAAFKQAQRDLKNSPQNFSLPTGSQKPVQVLEVLPRMQTLVVESAETHLKSTKSDILIERVKKYWPSGLGKGPEASGKSKQTANVKVAKRTAASDLGPQIQKAPTQNPNSNHLKNWGLEAIYAPNAWKISQGEGVKVLVLDTGADVNHPALVGQIAETRNFIKGFEGPETDVTDTIGHGTHVCGTIAARPFEGIVGVAPKAQLFVGRICDEDGCSTADMIRGMEWGLQKKVQVMNLSLVSDDPSKTEIAAVKKAEDAGVVVVAATGNGGKPKVAYPAAYPTVLGVGAVDWKMKRPKFSQFGPEMDLVGPGLDILSSVPEVAGCSARLEWKGKSLDAVCLFGSNSKVENLQTSLVDVNQGRLKDFKKLDLSGQFALIQRSPQISFQKQTRRALAAHAAGIIFVNYHSGLSSGAAVDDQSRLQIPVILVNDGTGKLLRSKLKGKKQLVVKLHTEAFNRRLWSGTSMASPHVAGVAALMKSANPELKPWQIREILKETSTKLTLPRIQYGAGFLNAEKAVAKALQLR